MKLELTFSITELSNLTNKTRPTLYKYIKAYEEMVIFNDSDKNPTGKNFDNWN